MNDEMTRFLAELKERGGPVAFAAMNAWATGADSRARQAARRSGYVERTRDDRGRNAWAITPKGVEALAAATAGAT